MNRICFMGMQLVLLHRVLLSEELMLVLMLYNGAPHFHFAPHPVNYEVSEASLVISVT
jgi:hypothetical protein